MLSPLWSTLRSIMFVLCFCILFGYAQSAHAGCEIKNVSFVGADYMLDDVPFFGGYRQPSSYKDVKITTNNDSSCENRKVYLTVFSRTQKNGDLGIPLDNIKNQEFVMKKLGDFAGAPEYGLAVSLYSGEEKCYSYGYDDLKRLITDGIKTGTRQKTEFEYLKNDPLTKDLYGFLFDDLTYSTNGGYVLNDYTMWTAKKLIHLKFGQAVECGYFARAKLDTEMNVAVAEEDGKPMARHSNDDYTNNNVGYMCNVSDYVYSIPNLPKDAIKTALGGSAGALIGAGAGASVASWAIVGTFVAPGVGTAVGAAAGLVVGLIVANEFTGFTDDVANLPSDVVEGIKQSVLDDYCESNTKWEVRNATSAFSPGALDPNDKCSINGTPTPGCYELLAPIPGLGTTINFDGINGQPPFALEQFFLAAINIIIGAISILAVLALMYYGYSMMRDRSRGNIAAISVDKTKLLNIFYGIGIILGSYVILNTINPELLVVAPKFDPIVFNAAEYVDDTPVSAPVSGGPLIPQLNVLPTFVHCPRSGGVAEFGKIVESLHGKTTYRLGGRGNPPYYGAEKNTDCPTPGLCYDCSGMVALIYACAGITKNIGATVSIFNNAEKINSIEMQSGNLLVNGKVANPGDLFGAQRWHVLMYMGGGISVDQTSDNNGRISGKGLRRMKSFIDWYNKAKERHEFYINRL